LIVAAGSRAAAETFARSWRPGSRIVSRGEFGFSPRRFRRTLRNSGAKELAVHTPNWRRQLNPQLYELLLALAPTQDRFPLALATPIGTPCSGYPKPSTGFTFLHRARGMQTLLVLLLTAFVSLGGGMPSASGPVLRVPRRYLLRSSRRLASPAPRRRPLLVGATLWSTLMLGR
jgi:hypothetical protein